MKKRERKRRAWLKRRVVRLSKGRRRFKRYRTHLLRFGEAPGRDRLVQADQPPRQRRHRRQAVTVNLPGRLTFAHNCAGTLRALGAVRETGERRVLLRYLNFDHLREISPAAALLLASEIDQWNRMSQGRLRANHETWDPNVTKLLCEMGFFELLGHERPPAYAATTTTRFLPFIRGEVDADRKTAGERAKELNRAIQAAAADVDLKRHLLFTGLSEAITNVSHHAYSVDGKRRPWWMFAAYDSASGLVSVVFLDHGLSIPATLPPWKNSERLKERFGAWNDGAKIRAAMELGRSGTGHIGRGKGLPDLLEVVKAHPGSSLRILSRRGLLKVENQGAGELALESSSLARQLKGTLIEWKFVPKLKSDAPIDRTTIL